MSKNIRSVDNFSFKFNQERFIVNSVSKFDIDELGFDDTEKFQLQVERSFDVLPHETNKNLAKVVTNGYAKLMTPEGVISDYISIKTSTYFKFDDDSDVDDENLRHLLISQANIQTTDIINSLLCKSELQGDPVTYNFHKID